ncbi:MAG: 4-hydroxy-3-methylbut-2-enyl diphosphate reductase [Deltaproteobacteria bacterium]|nr:4-hydroxy-3-methylbut-2-enyl diphosphate reductase [Deltaproteobacteria bacterium]
MKVTLADSLGTCFGVDDAITEAMDPQFRDNLTIIGQLVHNPQTVQELRDNGIEIVNSINDEIKTPNVMITAHGAAQSVIKTAQERGFKVFDASCPLVMKVHKAVAKLVVEGYYPVVLGQESHVEVRGIVTDLKEYSVIYDENDFHKLTDKPKLGIVSQTTNQIKNVLPLVEKIKALKNADGSDKEVKFVDTVCKPTKDRQIAVEKLSNEVNLMIVVGGFNSSNTKKLKKVCDDKNLPAYHIEKASELKPEWFIGIEHVGITAGTSTPSHVIDQVYQAVLAIGATQTGNPSSEPVLNSLSG